MVALTEDGEAGSRGFVVKSDFWRLLVWSTGVLNRLFGFLREEVQCMRAAVSKYSPSPRLHRGRFEGKS